MAEASRVGCEDRCDSGLLRKSLVRPVASSTARVDKQSQKGINGMTHPELRLRARSRRKAASAFVLAQDAGSLGS